MMITILLMILMLTAPAFADTAQNDVQPQTDSFTENTTLTQKDKEDMVKYLPDYE